MMDQGRKLATATLALALAASLGNDAMAADREEGGFYLGAGAGNVQYQLDDRYYGDMNFDPVDLDQSANAHTVYAGWQANRYLAVEFALADLGATDHYTACYTPNPTHLCVGASGPFRMETRRADLAFVVAYPLVQRLELLGKLGVSRYQHDIIEEYNPNAGYKYDTGVLLGVGLRFHASPSWAIRAQWDRAETTESSADTRYHVDPTTSFDTYLVSVEYRFGN